MDQGRQLSLAQGQKKHPVRIELTGLDHWKLHQAMSL